MIGGRLGVAVVGGGFMGRVHVHAARAARASVVGVVSSSPESSARAAAALDVGHAFDDLDDLLSDDAVDVVHVCTPNALHAEQVLAALAAGKHVVCEKPLATTVDAAERMVEAARGRTATVPFVYRFHPMVREARARVAAGETGRILTIAATYLQDWLLERSDDNWRVGEATGGASRAFADIGSHLVDLTEFVTGDRIARLSATTRTFFGSRATHERVTTEDAVALAFETATGALGTVLVSQAAPGRKNRLTLEVAGERESLAFDQEQPETLWIGRRAGSMLVPRDPDQLAPDAARLCAVPGGHPQGYQDAFNAFVADSYAAVAGEHPDGLPRFDDGLRAARVTDAVLRSAASGTWVTL